MLTFGKHVSEEIERILFNNVTTRLKCKLQAEPAFNGCKTSTITTSTVFLPRNLNVCDDHLTL
jgi:hypothetical protein